MDEMVDNDTEDGVDLYSKSTPFTVYFESCVPSCLW